MENIKIAIIGGTGKLGKEIAKLCSRPLIISSKTDPKSISYGDIDIFIDVSGADKIISFLSEIILTKKPLLVGSTGHNKQTITTLKNASTLIPILIASNFSKGIYLLKKLLSTMPASPDKITETHHIHKKDTPSGTAIELQEMTKNTPPISSIRKEEVFGMHTLTYHLPFEEIEITHKAHSREVFAKGALDASSFLYQKEKGYYTMENVYQEESPVNESEKKSHH